jgi:hypothetical protein
MNASRDEEERREQHEEETRRATTRQHLEAVEAEDERDRADRSGER